MHIREFLWVSTLSINHFLNLPWIMLSCHEPFGTSQAWPGYWTIASTAIHWARTAHIYKDNSSRTLPILLRHSPVLGSTSKHWCHGKLAVPSQYTCNTCDMTKELLNRVNICPLLLSGPMLLICTSWIPYRVPFDIQQLTVMTWGICPRYRDENTIVNGGYPTSTNTRRSPNCTKMEGEDAGDCYQWHHRSGFAQVWRHAVPLLLVHNEL